MFISKLELDKINSQIAFLQDLACKFQTEINELKVQQETKIVPAKTVRKHKNSRSAESRTRQSEKMKAFWASKKANEATT
jgi:hypothetical protein